MWYENIASRFFGLVTKHACDRQTDRQNYDSQDHASIAASRGKKVFLFQLWMQSVDWKVKVKLGNPVIAQCGGNAQAWYDLISVKSAIQTQPTVVEMQAMAYRHLPDNHFPRT